MERRPPPERTPPEVLVLGTRVFVYDQGDIEGIGIVQRGKLFPWVAEMIPDAIRAPGDEEYTDGRGPEAGEEPHTMSEQAHRLVRRAGKIFPRKRHRTRFRSSEQE